MRIGPAQANQSIAIGSTDGTNGGRVSLGYGGNSTPTTLGNSTWTLQAVGTEYRLTRTNSGGTATNPLTITEAGAATITGTLTCTDTLTTTGALGLLIRPATGQAVVRYATGNVRKWDIRTADTEAGSNTGANLEIVRGDDTGAIIDAPLKIDRSSGTTAIQTLVVLSQPTIGPTNTAGARSIRFTNNSGSVTLQITPTTGRTIDIPDNTGRITLTKNVTVTSSKTLALTDIDSIQFCQHTAAATITIPTNAAVAIPVGSEIRLINFAPEHRLTISTSGVTLFNQANLPQIGTDIVFVPDEAEIRLIKVATDSWILTGTNISPRLCHSFYSDCFSLDDPHAALVGGGTGNGVTASATEAGSPGILTLSTGSTASGRYALYTATTGLSLGSRRVFFESRCRVSALANVTDNFEAIAGLCDSITATPANGVFFRHSTQNSGNWQAVCRAAGSESVLNTSVASTIFASLTFLINRDGTSVEFWADGTSLGTLSTNIPNGLAQPIGFSFAQIRKTAGTTARGVAIDRYHAVFDL